MITNHPVSVARKLTTAGVALTVGALFTVSADAEPRNREAPAVVVKYGDLDLSTETGVHTLYRRIVVAAERVCPDNYTLDLQLLTLIDACRTDAVTRAIQAINNPKLAALHQQAARHG